MGKRMIIKGADFSRNGMGASDAMLEDLDITARFMQYGFYNFQTQQLTSQDASDITTSGFAYVYLDYTPVEGFTKIKASLKVGPGAYALCGYGDASGSNMQVLIDRNVDVHEQVVTIPEGVHYIRANSRTDTETYLELLR